ncbi:hypothetical protein [Nocardioides sp.]|uniref:hypothetical protein n=1 Tax=Nocardioides sp. TaxID=35761 RepID=UPI0025E705EC|nr:hypothetical protein [Nocardioides sp.]
MAAATPASLALSAVAALVLLGGCSSDGIGTVADDDGFRSCVTEAGASLDGSKDWDEEEQLAFWEQPGTLDCALDELDQGDREDALAGAFTDAAEDKDSARTGQLAVLSDWATRTGEAVDQSDAVKRAGLLIGSLWAADADEPGSANGMKTVVAFELYRAYFGEPTGFEDYLAHHTGNVTDPSDQVTRFVDRMQEDSNKSAKQRQEWDDLDGLVEQIDDVYDATRDA